jgi:hypothetical protein
MPLVHSPPLAGDEPLTGEGPLRVVARTFGGGTVISAPLLVTVVKPLKARIDSATDATTRQRRTAARRFERNTARPETSRPEQRNAAHLENGHDDGQHRHAEMPTFARRPMRSARSG